MKKIFLCLIAVISFAIGNQTVRAQQLETNENGVLNGVFQKGHTISKVPIPFEYLREADVMWSKTIWRKIDLFEKINLPLYYPEKPIMERMSMIDLLLDGIMGNQNQTIPAYDANPAEFNEFKEETTLSEILVKLGGGNDTIQVATPDGGVEQKIIQREINTKEVKTYLVKEVWFFDRQRSVLDVRIVGMCPIRTFYKPEDVEQEDPKYKMLFWVEFNAIRPLFSKHEVFNERNEAESRSYDDYFIKRIFSSYITQEANTYNNREIREYTIGLEAMLESERIKSTMFNLEQDLWEY